MSSAALLAQYKPSANLALAGTLPAAWYFDADMLQLEREKIFWRSWQPVSIRLQTSSAITVRRAET